MTRKEKRGPNTESFVRFGSLNRYQTSKDPINRLITSYRTITNPGRVSRVFCTTPSVHGRVTSQIHKPSEKVRGEVKWAVILSSRKGTITFILFKTLSRLHVKECTQGRSVSDLLKHTNHVSKKKYQRSCTHNYII